MKDFEQLLAAKLGRWASLAPEQGDALARHWTLLERWNQRLNLTAVRRLEEAIPLHYCESVFFGTLLPRETVRIMDVGSGAGFPGLPIAVVRPECEVWLVEANARKCVFLREAVRVMELENVRVVEARAEELGERVDWAVSRAVRWEDVVEIARRLAGGVGLLVSQQAAEEAHAVAGIRWSEPVKIPWGSRRVALLGNVLRVEPEN